jgi:hypothetical protein
MSYDQTRIDAIERTWLAPRWVPQKEVVAKAGEDIQYLIAVIQGLKFRVAELENHVQFNAHNGD